MLKILAFIIVLAAIGGAALFVVEHHPLLLQQSPQADTGRRPREGASPSAYAYMLPHSRRSAASAARSRGGGEEALGFEGSLSANTLDDFVAEVVDGDRHMLIHFHRMPVVQVGPGASASLGNSSSVSETVKVPSSPMYMPNAGWWAMTRPFEGAASGVIVASVLLNAWIAPDGSVQRAELISGPPDMGNAAIEAVKHSRYSPPHNGVPEQRQVTVNFSLSSR